MWQSAGRRDQVEQALERIYARPEFDQDEQTLFDDFIEWLVETFDSSGAAGPLGDVIGFLSNILLFLLAALFAWLLVRLVREYVRQRSSRRTNEVSSAHALKLRVRELYAAARLARDEGHFKLALQLGLFALVTGLGARGAFEYRDAWTYREILRFGQPESTAFELLSGLVEDLEAKEFGHEPISEQDLDRLESLCSEHLAGFLEEVA